ncbi:hypothetical protein ACVWZ3_007925 [Bradyrhizobium sp. i1.3.6]
MGLSGQLSVRHPLAMPGCCFWHERILRHQPALCRSAAALITARSYSAARHGRSGQSRKAPMRKLALFVILLSFAGMVPSSESFAQSALRGAVIGGAVGGRRGAAIGATAGAISRAPTGDINIGIDIIGGTATAGTARPAEGRTACRIGTAVEPSRSGPCDWPTEKIENGNSIRRSQCSSLRKDSHIEIS